ncbi:MAG: hypothetical protein GX162_03825 [Firmicutes bacterium]|nr:hypothetical protein [Bacillota bacterium]
MIELRLQKVLQRAVTVLACLMLAQAAAASDFEWMAAEKVRAAYFYEDAPFDHLDDLKAAGFNTALVKFRGVDNTTVTSIRERYLQLLRQQQGLPETEERRPSIDLDSIRAWAESAQAAGVRFFPVLDFAGLTEARVFESIIKPTVLKDGTARPKAPSPVDPVYWERTVKERLVDIAKLSAEVPIEGVLVDFELYAATATGLSTYSEETHYGDDAFYGFVNGQGLTQVEVPPDQRYDWLQAHGLLEAYRDFLTAEVRSITAKIREAVEEVNPHLKLGLLPYAFVSSPIGLRGGWFTKGVAAGWGTEDKPVLALSEYSFIVGYTEAIGAQRNSFDTDELPAVFLPGIHVGRFLPEFIGANCYYMTQETDGYWVFTTYSLYTPSHLLKDVYRIPGSTDEYWQAFQHVNTEIQRSLDEGPEYKTDLVLRPQVFDISARQNSPLPDLVPYMDADQPLSAPVGRPSQIRRSSQWFVYVTEGEELHLELQRIQIGSFRDSVTYLVEGLGGMIIAQGQLERGVNERQQVTVPVPPGIYSVRIEPGSGAVTLSTKNRYVVLEASQDNPVNVISRVRPLTFFVPEETVRFNVHLKASMRETVCLLLQDPQGNTVIDEVFDREAHLNVDAANRSGVWSLQLLRAPVGIFEDIEAIYLEGVPPYLSEGAERLLVPR